MNLLALVKKHPVATTAIIGGVLFSTSFALEWRRLNKNEEKWGRYRDAIKEQLVDNPNPDPVEHRKDVMFWTQMLADFEDFNADD